MSFGSPFNVLNDRGGFTNNGVTIGTRQSLALLTPTMSVFDQLRASARTTLMWLSHANKMMHYDWSNHSIVTLLSLPPRGQCAAVAG
jgi:hypothetical protein